MRTGEDDRTTSSGSVPTTIDWDRFYREFPDRYDRFALSSVTAAQEMRAMFGFAGTRGLSLASGTGKDSFEIARDAAFVVGVEPWVEMRSFAIAQSERLGVHNVAFVDGVAEDLSRFGAGEFDRALSIYGAPFMWEDLEHRQREGEAVVQECLRVVKSGGHVAFAGTTPGWRLDCERESDDDVVDESADDPIFSLLAPHGFGFHDVGIVVDYGSVDEALATYGFIRGQAAIVYIRERQTSRFRSSLRIYSRSV
jgi:SAM-dependent methyltransferase